MTDIGKKIKFHPGVPEPMRMVPFPVKEPKKIEVPVKR
jgi:hypothetical protein